MLNIFISIFLFYYYLFYYNLILHFFYVLFHLHNKNPHIIITIYFYKNAEKIYSENKDKVKVVIGHSAGGSAALQLHQKYNDIIPITYNAPVFAISNGLSDVDKSLKPLRFVTRFDPVSAFDYQARITDHYTDT